MGTSKQIGPLILVQR